MILERHRHRLGNEDLHHRLPAHAAFPGLVAQPALHVRPELPFPGQEIGNYFRFAFARFFLKRQQGVRGVNRQLDICGAPFLHARVDYMGKPALTQ